MKVRWEEFIIGSSFFVPCIDSHRFAQDINFFAAERGMKVKTSARVENGRWGVRVWRIL